MGAAWEPCQVQCLSKLFLNVHLRSPEGNLQRKCAVKSTMRRYKSATYQHTQKMCPIYNNITKEYPWIHWYVILDEQLLLQLYKIFSTYGFPHRMLHEARRLMTWCQTERHDGCTYDYVVVSVQCNYFLHKVGERETWLYIALLSGIPLFTSDKQHDLKPSCLGSAHSRINATSCVGVQNGKHVLICMVPQPKGYV